MNFLELPERRSSTNAEILRKPTSSKSQRIATFPRPVCSETARISARPGPNGDRMSLFRSSEPGDCYLELPRILLLRTRVNKGKEEGPRRYTPALTGDGEASLLPRRRTEDLRSIPGADGSQPLHLGFVGRLLWLGRNGQ